MRRIATYCFYDPNGRVARHKLYYLSQLVKCVDRLIVVCNGNLTVEGRKALEQFTEDIIVRENEGFDFWAHKTGLEYVGWDDLTDYDEYLLCNDTHYGPISPFEEVFAEMDKRDCDFWGILCNVGDEKVANHGGVNFPDGYVKDFLSGVFINFKSSVLKSHEFKQFWETLRNVTSYSQAFIYGEYHVTYFFQKYGFTCSSWQDVEVFRGRVTAITGQIPYELIKEHRMPLLRKKAVDGKIPLSELWHYGYGDEPYKALEYIKNNTDYDASLIWEDVLGSSHLSEIQERLQLEYIIPDNVLEREYTYDKKIAVICHIYYADLVEECATYSENFPEGTDFYLATTSEETLEEIHKEYGKRGLNYQVQVRPNIGFDIPTLCVTYAYVATSGEYEYICYFHDKKSTHLRLVLGEKFKLLCFDAIFGSKQVVKNIINTFEDNPKLGVMGANMPYHAVFFFINGRTWRPNFNKIEELAKLLELDIPLSKQKPAHITAGSMFWFRPEAMKKLLSHGFTYDDFSGEKVDSRDMTLAHAFERIFALVAQDSGYYFAHSITNRQARSDLANYQAMLFGNEGILSLLTKYLPAYSTYHQFMNILRKHMDTAKAAVSAPKPTPTPTVSEPAAALASAPLPQIFDLASVPTAELFGVVNAEDYLETVSTRLMLKKIIKRASPKFLWRIFNKIRWGIYDMRFKKKQ